MYNPSVFREERRDVLYAFIRSHPLGLLVSSSPNGPIANLIPFISRQAQGAGDVLQCHLARANGQLNELDGQSVLVVFQGSNTYVSPSLYATKQETGKVVPTWNFAMVQVRGKARLQPQEWTARQIRELTNSRETARSSPWSVEDAPADYIQTQLQHIVGVEIEVEAIEGKWKVSQNQPEANRRSVAAAFSEDGGLQEMTGWVNRYGKLE
jgi:transcriptional regulator